MLIGNFISPSYNFLSGDSDHNTYSICIEGLPFEEDKNPIDNVKNTLLQNSEFENVAANEPFLNYYYSVAEHVHKGLITITQ